MTCSSARGLRIALRHPMGYLRSKETRRAEVPVCRKHRWKKVGEKRCALWRFHSPVCTNKPEHNEKNRQTIPLLENTARFSRRPSVKLRSPLYSNNALCTTIKHSSELDT